MPSFSTGKLVNRRCKIKNNLGNVRVPSYLTSKVAGGGGGGRRLGGTKVSCILRHRGVQRILAYSWARPAILVEGKGRGGECFNFFCFFTFIPVPHSSLSLSFISSTISSISFLPFSGRRYKMTHKG